LLWLSLIGTVHAVDKSKASQFRLIDIRVQTRGFGVASTADIHAVLQSAAGELCRYWPRTQLPRIDVYHRPDHPQTDSRHVAGNRIAIGLTVRDNHWAQYSFQFAHEFCHALIDYTNDDRGLARDRRYANLWLEESLCETASLFTLRALSRSWVIAPPYPAWRNYAPWFSIYAEERLTQPEHRLPGGISFLGWFHANEVALRQDCTRRDSNTIVAAQLLPIFEKEPRGWGALAFFSRAANPNESLPQEFTKWRSDCPREFQRFVTKVAAVFEVQAKGLPAGDRSKSLSSLRVSGVRTSDKFPWNESDE
jgi:hypothetical protein